MELRHLRYLVMAAEETNISRAAARLNVSQPAVSRQIKDLEAELGVKLFEREHNGLRITEAGGTALAHARELLRQSSTMIEAMQAFAKRGQVLSIKVGFLPTALPGFLAEGMRKFNRTYQNVCVHVGHPLNWSPDRFLTKDKSAIICASHGATYTIDSGECFAGPGTGRSLQTIAVELRDGVIYAKGPDSLR